MKPSRRRRPFPAWKRRRDRHQNLLSQIVSVRILQAASDRNPVDHRLIDRDEPLPRQPIARIFDLNDQAFACFGEWRQDRSHC